MEEMKYVNAKDVTTFEDLKRVLLEDNGIKTVAVIGDNTLLNDLWKNDAQKIPEQASNLLVFCVDYGFLLHTGNEAGLTAARSSAIWEVFARWTNSGLNKHHAKKPFGSKSFNMFVDIDRYCEEVTYVVFAV